MPKPQLNWEWLISSLDGLRGLAAFPVKYVFDCDLAQRGSGADWQIVIVIRIQRERDTVWVSQELRFVVTGSRSSGDRLKITEALLSAKECKPISAKLNSIFCSRTSVHANVCCKLSFKKKTCHKDIAKTMSVPHSWKYFLDHRQEAYFPFKLLCFAQIVRALRISSSHTVSLTFSDFFVFPLWIRALTHSMDYSISLHSGQSFISWSSMAL